MTEPSPELLGVVERSSLPTLLVRVADEQIVTVSRSAARLLERAVDELRGNNVEELTADAPSGGFELIRTGRLAAFQAQRLFRYPDGRTQALQAWVRAGQPKPPVDHVVVVLWPRDDQAWTYLAGIRDRASHEIVGTLDTDLLIERVSVDVRVLGPPAERVVGHSILSLVEVSSSADVLQALAVTAETRNAVCVPVKVHVSGNLTVGELLLRPMYPALSFLFSVVVGGPGMAEASGLTELVHGLHGLAAAEVLAALADCPGADALTARELEIVGRLVIGDRVPAIATTLFLSQSTIRNHLSSIYRKLHVGSQQELIELYRSSRRPKNSPKRFDGGA